MTPAVDTHRLDLPRPANPPADSKISADDELTEPIGVHLVVAEQTLLFGTGYAETVPQLLARLESLPRPDVVVVEHGDPDHYGAVPHLREAFEDVAVAAPQADLERLEAVGISVDVPLQHGDVLSGFEVIHIPGHTPGNLSFVDADRGVLVVGDSFVGSESAIAAPRAWNGAFAMMREEFNADDAAATQNLARLEAYAFEVALLTHGEDVSAHARDELETLLNDLAAGE